VAVKIGGKKVALVKDVKHPKKRIPRLTGNRRAPDG
jgi:hypothetical protein